MKIRKLTAGRVTVVGAGLLVAAAIGVGSLGLAQAAGTTAATAASAQLPAAGRGQMVVIDGAKDKDAAIAALKLYKNATDREFTPIKTPDYSQTKWVPAMGPNGQNAPSITGNADKSLPIREILTVETETTSSWSLGGSIEETVGFDLPGVASADVSVKFNASHKWENRQATSQQLWVTAKPGKTVWIETSTSQVNVTGNFAFTSGGARYQVNNVTMTIPDAEGDAQSNATYRVMEINSVDAGLPANTDGGLKPLGSLRGLQNYIHADH